MESMDAEQKRLADEEFWRRVKRAREMTIDEKFAEAARLWEEECERMKAELRRDYPDADEKRIHQLLVERVNYMRQEEDALRAKMARLGIAP